VHYGERFDRRGNQPQNVSTAETLEELFCRYPVVVAHVAGHEHENYVEHHKCKDDTPVTPGLGDFWHVSTAAHIDWPQQARMIELVNIGGKLSMVVTMLDHDGPANPGGPKPPQQDQGEAGEQVLRLAGIGREIGYNDYQGSRGARGGRQDRNVILPLNRPPPPGP
jgi:hypothetical protein